MNDDFVTVDSILEWFKGNIEQKQIIPMNIICDSAQKLNILKEDLDDEIIELESILAQEKVNYLENGDSVAKAKSRIEATEDFQKLQKLKAKKERIEEHIRIIKIRARQQEW